MSGELDEFRLVRQLGRGGMGEVYLGHDTVLDRPVAIKLIGARNPGPVSRERFLTEARAIARLSHPNVVAIYRVGTTGDGRPFLVQELIRGNSLDRVARPMPWREVCELAIGIARGLEAAHRRGILHRDVKPANVMIDEHGVARLLDFGVAKLTGAGEQPPDAPLADAAASGAQDSKSSATPDERKRSHRGQASGGAEAGGAGAARAAGAGAAETCDPSLATADTASTTGASGSAAVERIAAPGPSPDPTVPGTMLGTPRYLAPELWLGGTASVQSDLYSLGALLYELVTGAAPYPETDLDELRRAVLAAAARPIAELALDAHPALARLVMRCLAFAPRERPASAAAVAHELAAVTVGAPAVPEGNPYRGLRAFDAAHRAVFFGRDPDVDAIVDRLRTEPLIAVVGDSGIGKSSVCHAGVVPAVTAGALGDRRRWRAVSLVPGRAPWAALCDALAIAEPDADLERVVRALRPGGDAGLLLVIDQLEELVTLAAPGEAARVADAVAVIAAGGLPGVKALLAVRGDFLTRVAALLELGAPMTRGLHLLRALSAADLREAVVGPARATGVRYDTDAMVDELVAAVGGNPGALPLLQFTLAELWQARDPERGVIPAGALDRLGGVAGGLAGHADAVLLGMATGVRTAARRIVLRLVSDARTRAVRERNDLVGDSAVAAAALESLVRGRLVVARDTASGAPSYELAHEALIRGWGALRDWLDEEAGQLAARNRLTAAAAEWQRLERRPDLLWTRRQLDEVHALDELTAGERGFVDASGRLVRRRLLARIAAIAAVSVVATAIAAVWLDSARARVRAFAALVDVAGAREAEAARLAGQAAAARAAAFARFDADDGPGGDKRWTEARRLSSAAQEHYATAAAQLEGAFAIDSTAARQRLAAIVWAEAELAEVEHDEHRIAAQLARLRRYAPERAARWDEPGSVVLALDRPGRIAIHAFGCYHRSDDCVPGGGGPTIAGGFDQASVVVRDAARLDHALAPGSYLAVIEMPDGPVIRAPFVIGRGQAVALTIAVPPASATPAGFVYIPEGDFLYGSNSDDAERANLGAQPLHRVHGRAFWISRSEVTFAQWIAFLRDLPPAARRQYLPSAGDVSLDDKAGRFVVALEPSPDQRRSAAEGELLTYPGRENRRDVRWEQLPVSGVSYVDAVAYAAWLVRTGRVPGARICTDREWEHAARGADGRSYPHGRALRAADANIDETYGRKPAAFGPDEVGSYPASNSPYDVADLAGNVWELVIVGKDKPWLVGGSFYQTAFAASCENRGNPADRSQVSIRAGLRICADAASAR